jgi:hypothetical protein
VMAAPPAGSVPGAPLSLLGHSPARGQRPLGQAPPGGAQLPAASARLAFPPADLPDPPNLDELGSYLASVPPGLLVWPPPQGLPQGLPVEVKACAHTYTATANCDA